MSEELKKRFARSDKESRAAIRHRVRAAVKWGCLFVLFGVAMYVTDKHLLPWIQRPDAETREAYEAVASNLLALRPFEKLSPEHKALLLDHSDWTGEDVQLVDQKTREAAEVQEAAMSSIRGSGSHSYTTPPQVVVCVSAALRLREWDADGALDLLKSAE